MTDISRRAAPLPPEERRAALIAATLPLVMRCGTAVTTRAIADAAGVAEGTIFRVFDSKDDLVAAAVASAMDPQPVARRLRSVDRAAPLRDRLFAAVTILQERLAAVAHLMDALGLTAPPQLPRGGRAQSGVPHEDVLRALAELVEPDQESLRYPPAEVARRVRIVTFAGTHPRLTDSRPLTAGEIVDLLLDGVRRDRPC